MNLRDVLKDKFSEEEVKHVVGSFDIIGTIAIIDVPEELKERESEIADAIMSINKNVRTVCRRAGEHSGEFRVRPVVVIGGERTTETYYVESGARMHLDVNKVYFT
ncbi:class I SAM-dependent methyltransferase family protein, partial [Candidatus Micrarchaeota archaeon]|nr:class I SAM-dependent methyltransferase family protein [Candidatus Micrarchaeota archaeon]